MSVHNWLVETLRELSNKRSAFSTGLNQQLALDSLRKARENRIKAFVHYDGAKNETERERKLLQEYLGDDELVSLTDSWVAATQNVNSLKFEVQQLEDTLTVYKLFLQFPDSSLSTETKFVDDEGLYTPPNKLNKRGG